MLPALRQIEDLLRRYGHAYEANQAAIVGEQFQRDPLAACRMINSDDWWDHRQSVAAIDLAVAGGFTAESRRDALAFRLALIQVFETLQAFGEQNAAGELIVAQFVKWNESHV